MEFKFSEKTNMLFRRHLLNYVLDSILFAIKIKIKIKIKRKSVGRCQMEVSPDCRMSIDVSLSVCLFVWRAPMFVCFSFRKSIRVWWEDDDAFEIQIEIKIEKNENRLTIKVRTKICLIQNSVLLVKRFWRRMLF